MITDFVNMLFAFAVLLIPVAIQWCLVSRLDRRRRDRHHRLDGKIERP